MALPDRYRLIQGTSRDRALLLKFLTATYEEIFPEASGFAHLAQTVEQYFSAKTPIWWVEIIDPKTINPKTIEPKTTKYNRLLPIATLWIGNAVDQATGECYAHIFMIYVHRDHRRQGIATALIEQAQTWAMARGDRKIGLQVFSHNQPALDLYKQLGFQPHSLFLLKPLPVVLPTNLYPDS